MNKDKQYYEQEATEEEFIKWYKQQDLPNYKKPSVTTDMVAFAYIENKIKLLMIKRKANPFRNKFALPGGFLNEDENSYQGWQREVEEETNIKIPIDYIEQLATYTQPRRDPRDWIVTIAHIVYLPKDLIYNMKAGDDSLETFFVDVDFHSNTLSYKGTTLTSEDFAFDHEKIILEAMERLRGRLDWNPSFLKLLGNEITAQEGTNIINLISPNKPIATTNFIRLYGKYLIDTGDVVVQDKKKSRKIYKFK